MRAELLSFLFFSLFHRLSSHSLACLFGNIKGISAVFSGGEPSGLWWCFCGSFAELFIAALRSPFAVKRSRNVPERRAAVC